MEKDLISRIELARYLASKKMPYLASALFRLPIRFDPGTKTASISPDGVISLGSAFAEADVKSLAFVLAHEVLHWTLDFWARLGVRDLRTFNAAHDLEINQALVSAGMSLPKDSSGEVFEPLLPGPMGLKPGLIAEEYYELLIKRRPQDPDHSGSGKTQKGQKGQGSGSGQPGDKDPDQEKDSGSGRGLPKFPEDVLPGEKRSGSEEGLSEDEAQSIREQVARDAARDPGSVPGSVLRALEPLIPKKAQVPWETLLHRHLCRARDLVLGEGDEPAWNRPPRRLIGRVVLPRRARYEPEVALVIDTSGSIGPAELSTTLTQVGRIASAVGEVTVITVDAKIQAVARVSSIKSVLPLLKGGGGTDMRLGIEHARRLGADIVVVLTDGYTPWPDRAPSIPVIVALIGGDDVQVPGWAKVVRIRK